MQVLAQRVLCHVAVRAQWSLRLSFPYRGLQLQAQARAHTVDTAAGTEELQVRARRSYTM